MKKISVLLAVVLVSITGIFTGCDEAEDLIGPKLQFFGDPFIDGDVTVAPGAVISFSWLATKGASNLASFTIERDGITLSGYPDEDIEKDSYTDNVTLEAPLNEGSYVYEFTVTDNKDLSASVSFTITVEKVGGAIDTWSQTLGSHQSDKGSSFASSNGQVYTIADAKANSSLIDFMYFYGASNLATLAAPDDSDVDDVFSGSDGPANWSTRNATRFAVTLLTATEFDDMEDDLTIVEEADGAPETKVNKLSDGDVVAFVTAAGKMGLVKIVSITSGADGEVDIEVKVQQ